MKKILTVQIPLTFEALYLGKENPESEKNKYFE